MNCGSLFTARLTTLRPYALIHLLLLEVRGEYALFLAMLESVGGLEDDKDDKSEVSDKARGEEVGF